MHTRASVLLAEPRAPAREALMNRLLMSGAERVVVATNSHELCGYLGGDAFDLVLLAQDLFLADDARRALRRFNRESRGVTIVLLDHEGGRVPDRLVKEFKVGNVVVCVSRTNVNSLLGAVIGN